MKKFILLGAAVGAVISFNASAVEVTVTENSCGFGNATLCEQMRQEIKSAIEEELPEVSIDKYGTGVANANSFAQKGLTSEYADRFSFALVKVGGGAAIQGDMDELQEDPAAAEGFAAGVAATAGVNLDILPIEKIGFIDFSKMDLFLSVGAFDSKSNEDGIETEGEVKSFALMARYQLIDSVDIVPGNILHWGGVSLHTGIERASFKGKITKSFDDETIDIGGGQTATISNALGVFDLDAETTTIPVELSTSIRTIWALTFYTGAGFDFVSGSAETSINATGDATGASYDADILVNDSGKGDADPTNLRAFVGAQLNIPFVRVYTHLNKGLGSDLLGANLGVKILY